MLPDRGVLTRALIWGEECIFIYLSSARISKEITWGKLQYMNIHPPS